MSTRSTLRCAAGALSAALVLTLLPGPAQADPDGPIVLTVGHVDGVDLHWVNGEMTLLVHDDTVSPAVIREPGDVLYHANEHAEFDVPAGLPPAYGFLGEPGDTIWLLPQTQAENPDVLWLGWGSERFPTGITAGAMDFSLVDVEGPGDVVLYQTGPFGDPHVLFDSSDGLPDTTPLHQRAHVHGSWVFTEPGPYELTFQISGTSATNGSRMSSAPTTYDFHVGALDEVPAPRTPVESFVTAALTDFLGEADPAAVTAGVAALEGGATRAAYLRDLSTSDAWLAAVVERLYTDTLGRPADPGGLAHWTDQLRSGRRSVAQVAAAFYSSGEYYAGIGGGTPESWVRDLYEKILLRPADPSGLAYWVQQIRTQGRTAVAHRFYQSDESARTRVAGLYDTLLGRAPDASGHTYWAGQVVRRGDLGLAVSLAGSAEYAQRAVVRFP